MVSWTVANAGGFSVTKNGAVWANSGLGKADAGLRAGEVSYQIKAEPRAYAATASWVSPGAVSSRVTGQGFDSGWISGTSEGVPHAGVYRLTVASGANGGGDTVSRDFTAPDGPVAVVASTTVKIQRAPQLVTVSPTEINVAPYDDIRFTASGGHTVYGWGGQAFGSGSEKILTAPLFEGDYTVTVQDPGNADWEPSNLALAVLHVRKVAQPLLTLRASTPQIYASTQTLSASGGANGTEATYQIIQESAPGVASLVGAELHANSGTGWVDLQASKPANSVYQAVASAVVRVYLAKAPQRISLSPSMGVAQPGQELRFDAKGGQTVYQWGGLGSGSGESKSFTAPLLAGDYRVSVQALEDANYQASPIEQGTLRVEAPVQVTLKPLASEKIISDPASPLNGRRFQRLWQDKTEWCAYLGRDGLQFEVSGISGKPSVQLELQSKSSAEDAEWVVLASGAPTEHLEEGGRLVGRRIFALRLGALAADNPLVPLSYQQGSPLTGTWHFRARAQDSDGRWSDWTPELPVRVLLPLMSRSEQVQTLPPAGAQGSWFKASEVKEFEFQLWVP